MVRYYDISTPAGKALAIDELQRDLNQASILQKRVHITLEFYNNKCNSCGKELAVGDEYKYADYTRCYACKRDDEEFDDEMS